MSIKKRVVKAVSLHYLVWLAMFVVVVAVAFGATGVFLLLAPTLGSAIAAFVVAGGLIGLLVLIGVLAWLISVLRKQARRSERVVTENRHPQSELFIEDQLRPILGDRAVAWARANPGLLTVGALSAGVLLAMSPGIRRTLLITARPMLVRRGLSALLDNDGN